MCCIVSDYLLAQDTAKTNDNDGNEWFVAHHPMQSQQLFQADYQPDIANATRANFICSLTDTTDQTSDQLLMLTRLPQWPLLTVLTLRLFAGYLTASLHQQPVQTTSRLTVIKNYEIVKFTFWHYQTELSSNTFLVIFWLNKDWLFWHNLLAGNVATYFQCLWDWYHHWPHNNTSPLT